MAQKILDFAKFQLSAKFNPSSGTQLTIIADSAIYNLSLQRQGGTLTDFRLSIVEKTDITQFLRLKIEDVDSETTVNGKKQYVLNIKESDASNLMIGLADDDDGTNSDANIIATNVSDLSITEFSVDSKCILAVGSGEYNELLSVFTAGTTTNTAIAGEGITVLGSWSLHTDGKLYNYHNVNYPNLVGIGNETVLIGVPAEYTTFGGNSTGHIGLTIGVNQFAENTGAITESSSTTTTLVGVSETATTIRVIKIGDSVSPLTQVQAEDETSTVFGSISGERLDQFVVDSTKVVHTTEDESVGGIKTFEDDKARSTTNAAPTSDLSFANKKYVDDSVGIGAETFAIDSTGLAGLGTQAVVISHSLGVAPKAVLVQAKNGGSIMATFAPSSVGIGDGTDTAPVDKFLASSTSSDIFISVTAATTTQFTLNYNRTSAGASFHTYLSGLILA